MPSGMLHELLFTLMGHTGDVFSSSEAAAAGSGSPRVVLDARVRPLVNVSEAALLERLASLGGEYAALVAFVEQNAWWGLNARGERNGAYLAALCAGLQQDVLDPYCAAVLDLEQQALRAPATLVTLSGFAHALRVHSVVLPMVRAVLRAGQVGGAGPPKGAQVLDTLHVAGQQGDPLGRACFEALQYHCHGVMYRYLGAWMVHGLLLDASGEFFVDEAEPFKALRERAGGEGAQPPSAASATQLGTEFLRDWHERFFVRLDALPSYVTVRTAEAALFVGKAVRVLDHRLSAGRGTVGQGRTQQGGGEGGPEVEELITAVDREMWERELREVRDGRPFRSATLELAVERIRGTVSDRLWQLVVERGRLMDHLALAKDYFLLARGDFYQCLVEEVDPVMRVPPRPATVDLALDAAFAQAGARSTADDDPLFRRLRVSLQRSSFAKDNAESGAGAAGGAAEARAGKKFVPDSVFLPQFDDGWDVLGLEYRVEWPAALVIGPGSLRRYNAMWRHLFRLRRAQHHLERTWATGMAVWKDIERVKRRVSFVGRPEAKIAFSRRIASMQASWTRNWRLRNRMAYLVTNLQFYIQVDVIETRYAELVRQVSAARDFESVVRAHERYVAALLGECFLDLSMVTGLLEKLLRLCEVLCATMREAHARFHEVLQDAEDEGIDDPSVSGEEEARAAQLEEEISRCMGSLYTILRSDRLANSKRAPCLRQLLLRLNFNGFVGSAVARVAGKGKPAAFSSEPRGAPPIGPGSSAPGLQ